MISNMVSVFELPELVVLNLLSCINKLDIFICLSKADVLRHNLSLSVKLSLVPHITFDLLDNLTKLHMCHH